MSGNSKDLVAEVGDWVTLFIPKTDEVIEDLIQESLQGVGGECFGKSVGDVISYGTEDYIIQYIDKRKIIKSIYTKKEPSKVYLFYKLTNTCTSNKHPVNSVTLSTTDLLSGKKISINAFYCELCKKYYVNYELISQYHKNHLYPGFHFLFDSTSAISLKKVSPLRLFGYTVKEGELSEKERHNILKKIITNELISKQEIIRNLEFYISYNGKKENNVEAKRKWKEDLLFVSGFVEDNQEIIKGKIIRE